MAEDIFEINASQMMTAQCKYEEAKEYGRSALSLFKRHNDKLGITVAYINIQAAHYFLYENAKGNKKEMQYCLALLDSALIAMNGIVSPEHYIKIYENKSELFHSI